MMSQFLKYIALIVLILLPQQKSQAQKGTDYPELYLYNKTLSPEYIQTYRKALETYKKTAKADSTSTKRSKNTIEIEKLSKAFTKSFQANPVNYTSAFVLALELEVALDNISEEQYPEKRADYFRLGEVYYLFNDFEKSIPILKKAITETPPNSFTDRSNLNARKIIGICYANLNEMDKSDYYFRSVLESSDIVLDRPLYNAYALSYLGCNAMIKGEYKKALALDDAVLPFFRSYTDYGHLAGMFYCRSNSYFALGDIYQSGLTADSILYYANRDTYNPNKRRKQAFTALIRYNAAIGNASQTKAFSDSLIKIYKQESFGHTSQYIASAHQIKHEQDIVHEQRKTATYRRVMIAVFIAVITFIIFSTYTVIQYRRLRIAYRTLAEKSRRWAEQITEDYRLDITEMPASSTTEDIRVMQQIQDYVIVKKNYLDAELSLEKMSKELNINRTYLSSAINNVMGKNFNAYVNEYRISEAIRMFNDPACDDLPIDSIYLSSGFNNKRSFYIYFKKITGIPPGEYRESRMNKQT